ncbi:MAG TPA: lipoyl(octanoyl) transferase LipB [Sandaracinaceae bacterium LLY-WYZ-13_1]|nr:lipoyl(octanoyl) transferase LipB [Sandaracinaceae bacterium LLY-WYZ-13_1]
MRRTIAVHHLGRIDYADALELQERLQRARIRGAVPDTLLLLEHPPVITLGRGAKEQNVLWSRERLEARGFAVHEIGRGGDVTYHGPGQLVGYPIVDLAPDRKDVRRYVRDLEELMVRLSADYGLEAGRVEKMNGTWIGDRKIGAIGVRISRWVTMHGFAYNVSTDLAHFGVIVPCGIADRGVTSLERELDRAVPMDEVLARLEAHFASIFDADLTHPDAPPLAGLGEAAWAPAPWRDAAAR